MDGFFITPDLKIALPRAKAAAATIGSALLPRNQRERERENRIECVCVREIEREREEPRAAFALGSDLAAAVRRKRLVQSLASERVGSPSIRADSHQIQVTDEGDTVLNSNLCGFTSYSRDVEEEEDNFPRD